MKNLESISPLLAGQGLPDIKEITSEEVEQSIPILLDQLNNEFSVLEADLKNKLVNSEALTWDEVMKPLY